MDDEFQRILDLSKRVVDILKTHTELDPTNYEMAGALVLVAVGLANNEIALKNLHDFFAFSVEKKLHLLEMLNEQAN